jgi:hypothetical protein
VNAGTFIEVPTAQMLSGESAAMPKRVLVTDGIAGSGVVWGGVVLYGAASAVVLNVARIDRAMRALHKRNTYLKRCILMFSNSQASFSAVTVVFKRCLQKGTLT